MLEAVRRVDYYYVTVEDKRGEAYWLMQHFRERGVNLLAFTAFPLGGGRSQLDFVSEDAQKLINACKEAGIRLIGPKRAFLVHGDDKVGAVVDLHAKLSNAEINVHAANGVVDGKGRFGYLFWVNPDHYEEAAMALGV